MDVSHSIKNVLEIMPLEIGGLAPLHKRSDFTDQGSDEISVDNIKPQSVPLIVPGK
jgi:hypothetical protein